MTTTMVQQKLAAETAEIIRSQIQTPVLWALGASDLAYTWEDGKPGLTFKVRVLPYRKDGTRSMKARVMRLYVLHNALDYYDIKVEYVDRGKLVEHLHYDNVDCFSLNEVLLSIDSMDDRA